MTKELISIFEKNNILLNDDLITKLDIYYNYLIEYNKVVNLTRITEYNEFYIKHYLDSLIPFKDISLDNKLLFDLGSGAGFPGLVLAIFNPKAKFVLCESIKKKALFLEKIVKELALKNVSIFNERAEKYHDKVDFITARAVSKVSNILNYVKNITKDRTKIFLYKGLNYQDEVSEYNNRGYKLLRIDKFNLPYDMGSRVILIYTK